MKHTYCRYLKHCVLFSLIILCLIVYFLSYIKVFAKQHYICFRQYVYHPTYCKGMALCNDTVIYDVLGS